MEKKGIKLKYWKIEAYPEESELEKGEVMTPAEEMGLNLHELRRGDDHEKKGIITEN